MTLLDTLLKKKVAFVTLGCKLNFSETATISRQFVENNYVVVPANQVADVYVINTCSVTSMAEKKSRQTITKIKKLAPQAIIVAVGCYAQLRGGELAEHSGVNLVLGTNDKFNIINRIENITNSEHVYYSCRLEEIQNYNAAFSVGERTRAFLKVQDGCDYFCAYCTIPYARGRSRNDSIANIIEQAKIIASQNIKEIIITGVNTGDFGKTTGEKFIDLLHQLNRVDGVKRYRISSIEPNLLTDEVIEFIATSTKFLPHVHLPLQAGSDNILALMKRKYSTDFFAGRVATVKKHIPDCFIGVDVIVGFPGETEDDFQCTYDFLNQLDISFLHVFPYSDRSGTVASTMKNKVQNSVVTKRTEILQKLSCQKHRLFYENNIGTQRTVLFENKASKGKITGFTENYIKVEASYDESLLNNLSIVRLNELKNENVFVLY